MAAKRPPPIEQYQVVCALPHEMTASIPVLDERHQPVAGQDKFDENTYIYYTPCIVHHNGAQLLVFLGDPQRVERRT
jgi:hypothetical protein